MKALGANSVGSEQISGDRELAGGSLGSRNQPVVTGYRKMAARLMRCSLAGIVAALAMASPALATTYEVTRTDDPTPGGCKPKDCSLREAISAANARFGPDTVLLRGGKTYLEQLVGAEDANASGDFDINDVITIRRSGRGLATVDGNGLDRVFEVITPGSDRVTLSHLKITGGIAPGATGQGGGVLNQAVSHRAGDPEPRQGLGQSERRAGRGLVCQLQ